jgi:GNAT superfamily N-acetyltransferase
MLVRPLDTEDRQAWGQLYAGYAEFYGVASDESHRDLVWSWLQDPSHPSHGLGCVDEGGALIGIAHYRAFPRPLSGTTGCYLDDLFVSPAARGQGVARSLLAELAGLARDRGWSVVRWITADSNVTARALYDQVALQTAWVTYDMPPAG